MSTDTDLKPVKIQISGVSHGRSRDNTPPNPEAGNTTERKEGGDVEKHVAR